MVDRLNELTKIGDEIQGRLYAAAERVDRLDRSLLPSKRAQLAPALREVWSIADELIVHSCHTRISLNL